MTTSKTQALVLLPVFAFCSACKKKEPIVVIDDWSNVDFAKNDCELRARGGDPCIGETLLWQYASLKRRCARRYPKTVRSGVWRYQHTTRVLGTSCDQNKIFTPISNWRQ
jgi:hypothetical protein